MSIQIWSLRKTQKKLVHTNNQDTLCIIRLNCTFIKVVNGTSLNGTSSQTYVYSCVKKEELLGYITLGIMFSPGILFAYLLYHGSKNWPKKYIIILISPVLCLTFPLLVFLTKVRTQFLQFQSSYCSFSNVCALCDLSVGSSNGHSC